MLRMTLAALLVAGAAGLGGCASYSGGGYGYGAAPGYYTTADVDAYSYPAYSYNPVIVPSPYPYTYQRHNYYPFHGHPNYDHRNWGTHALGNPAWPRGNYGPGHGAYRPAPQGRGAVSPGAIAGDR